MLIKEIRKGLRIYTLLLIVTLGLTAAFALGRKLVPVLFFGVVAVAIFFFLIGWRRRLFEVTLIWDNRILTVPSAVIYSPKNGEGKEVGGTVVSTFGLLIGDKIHKWGSEGIYGVRLAAIKIDRQRLSFTFGEENYTRRVELFHGIDDGEKIREVKNHLWRETGVTALVCGWGEEEPGGSSQE